MLWVVISFDNYLTCTCCKEKGHLVKINITRAEQYYIAESIIQKRASNNGKLYPEVISVETLIIREKQDLIYLNWSKIRESSRIAGPFLKATSDLGGSRSIIDSQTMTTSGT